MSRPVDYRKPQQLSSEAAVLESLRELWQHTGVIDDAVHWLWSSPDATPEARKRAADALRTIAWRCRSAASGLTMSAELRVEFERLGVDW